MAWIFGGLLILCLPSSAHAYEDRVTVGFAIGYAGMPRADSPPRNGLGAALSVGGGLGDAWSLQGVLGYDALVDGSTWHVSTAGLEAVYALDIVRFVPLLGFGIDGLLSVRNREARGDFALHGLVGFDFLIDRRWSIGADVRGYWVATHARSPLDALFVTAAARAGMRFPLRRADERTPGLGKRREQ